MAVQRRPFNRTRSRRMTDWGFGVDFIQVEIDANEKILGTTSLAVDEPVTIIRIRGQLHVLLTSANVASGGFAGAAGIALVNSDAFIAGIASIPGPQSDAHWDSWIWHSYWDVRTATATFADAVNVAGMSQRMVIDSKAMRKWDPAETLVMVVEGTEAGVATAILNADTRILLKAG